MLSKILSLIILTTIISACATPKVVERKKYTDEQLSCEELRREMDEAEEFKRKALKEKGVTGTNAAAVIFFWPAVVATYSNVNEAVDAAEDRKNHLYTIFRQKQCTNVNY